MERDSDCDYDYDYDYVDPVPPPLECPICRCAFVEPVKTPDCDHLFCRRCLTKSLRLALKCPVDRTPIPLGIDSCPVPHRALVQLVGDLKVNYNGQTLARDQVDRIRRAAAAASHSHQDRHSPADPHPHPDSNSDSDDSDAAAPVPCEHCTLVLPLAAHPAHLLSTCAVIPRPCPHASRGCPYSGPRALLEQDHLASECAYEPLAAYLDRQDAELLTLRSDNWALETRLHTAEHKIDQLADSVQRLTACLGEFAPPPLPPAGFSSRDRGDHERRDNPVRPASNPQRPAPTKRTSSSSSNTGTRPDGRSSSSPARPDPLNAHGEQQAAAPLLVTTLSQLQQHQAHLSTLVNSLAHSHSHQLGTTLALSEDLASLRTQVTGVRIQMSTVMRDVYGGGGGGAASCGPATAAGGGLRVPRPTTTTAAAAGGSSGSSAEEDNDESAAFHHHHHHPQRRQPRFLAAGTAAATPSSSYEDEDLSACHPSLHPITAGSSYPPQYYHHPHHHYHHHSSRQHAVVGPHLPPPPLPFPLPIGMRNVHNNLQLPPSPRCSASSSSSAAAAAAAAGGGTSPFVDANWHGHGHGFLNAGLGPIPTGGIGMGPPGGGGIIGGGLVKL
ncbi:hypothetical protein JCM3774_004484 [Rhodotorula dairenensis]